jgi:hypothetical protein
MLLGIYGDGVKEAADLHWLGWINDFVHEREYFQCQIYYAWK